MERTSAEGPTDLGPKDYKGRDVCAETIPASVETIWDKTFEGTGLESVSFETNAQLQKVGRCAFAETKLKGFEAPLLLRVLSQGVFCKCEELKSVTLNEGLEVLGTNEHGPFHTPLQGVFQESALETIGLPSTLKRIEYSAFWSCVNLRSIELPVGLTYIGTSAFQETGLEEIFIPRSVKEIGSKAFYKCARLRTLIIDTQTELQKIGRDAFADSGLYTIYAPTDLKEGVQKAFPQHTRLIKLPAGNCAACNRRLGSIRQLETVKLPDGLEVIGARWFAESCVEEIFVPASVHTIESWAFSKCLKLRRVIVAVGSVLRQVGEDLCCDCRNIETVFVPKNVRVDESQFSCLCVTIIRLPEQQDTIGGVPIKDLRAHDEVSIPDGVSAIPPGAFAGSEVKKITFPASMRMIGEQAFYDCEQLEGVRFMTDGAGDQKPVRLGDEAFSYTKVDDFTLPASLESVGDQGFFGCMALKWVRVDGPQSTSGDHYLSGTKTAQIRIPELLGTSKRIFSPSQIQCDVVFT